MPIAEEDDPLERYLRSCGADRGGEGEQFDDDDDDERTGGTARRRRRRGDDEGGDDGRERDSRRGRRRSRRSSSRRAREEGETKTSTKTTTVARRVVDGIPSRDRSAWSARVYRTFPTGSDCTITRSTSRTSRAGRASASWSRCDCACDARRFCSSQGRRGETTAMGTAVGTAVAAEIEEAEQSLRR